MNFALAWAWSCLVSNYESQRSTLSSIRIWVEGKNISIRVEIPFLFKRLSLFSCTLGSWIPKWTCKESPVNRFLKHQVLCSQVKLTLHHVVSTSNSTCIWDCWIGSRTVSLFWNRESQRLSFPSLIVGAKMQTLQSSQVEILWSLLDDYETWGVGFLLEGFVVGLLIKGRGFLTFIELLVNYVLHHILGCLGQPQGMRPSYGCSRPLDWIENCLLQLAFVTHKNLHFKFHNRIWDARIQSDDNFFS